MISDRKDQLSLVLELARVAPEMLVSVLPQLQALLLDESVEVRFPFVKLVASIAVNHPIVARDYNSLLIGLFRRILDADSDVRLFMCSHAKTWLLHYHSTHAEYLEGMLFLRVTHCFDASNVVHDILKHIPPDLCAQVHLTSGGRTQTIASAPLSSRRCLMPRWSNRRL